MWKKISLCVEGFFMGVMLKLMDERRISTANYITFVNPAPHPDRIMSEHDFLYMIDGSWRIREEDEAFEMHSDDLLILPAGRHHYGDGLSTPHNKHMYIHVIPLGSERAANVNGSGFEEGEPGCLAVAEPAEEFAEFHSLIHCQSNPHIKELFQEIIAECWAVSSFREQKLSLLLNLLMLELKEQQEKPYCSSSNSILEEASRLIQTTPQTFFTGKELAERFYVCERTLSNQFKKVYGKTLYAYQMDVKLEMVRQFLLSQPEVKLHETALNFGFCDEFHLSRTFKKKYGVSPSRYREISVD